VRKLLFCYVSGLDLRRVDAKGTPFLSDACSRYPIAPFVNLPSNELFPTLVTGVDPTVHGVWGIKIDSSVSSSTLPKVLRWLPDRLATTIQGCLHLSSRTFDLAAMPPRRRRRFHITRTKYKRRTKKSEALFQIGGVHTVFDVIGKEKSRYLFDSSYDPEKSVLGSLCGDSYVLEVIELYSLDRYQQWNLDRPKSVANFYSRIDQFLNRLNAKCQAKGWSLMIVSDHGHEPIQASHDLESVLKRLTVPQEDYSYFIEVSSARFWFHTDGARCAVMPVLLNLSHGTVMRHHEMGLQGVPLRDTSYGEVFVYLDPGHIFFPHDFHHPIANLWLGITDPMQRSRLRDPRHRGNHGHLPHFEAEKSFALLIDPSFEVAGGRATILDVAPSILRILGCKPPPTMRDRYLFRLKES
jgi:hypothetical protein